MTENVRARMYKKENSAIKIGLLEIQSEPQNGPSKVPEKKRLMTGSFLGGPCC